MVLPAMSMPINQSAINNQVTHEKSEEEFNLPPKKQQQQINNYNVLFGFLQWEIRVVVPGESQLQQSRAI